MRTYVIDTHALVWFIAGDTRLGSEARVILRDPDIRLIIPTIVLAEIKYLAHKGRVAHTLDDVLRVLYLDPRCLIYPMDTNVVVAASPGLDIHDSLIVGTALVQPEPVDGILTRDQAIITVGLVPTAW